LPCTYWYRFIPFSRQALGASTGQTVQHKYRSMVQHKYRLPVQQFYLLFHKDSANHMLNDSAHRMLNILCWTLSFSEYSIPYAERFSKPYAAHFVPNILCRTLRLPSFNTNLCRSFSTNVSWTCLKTDQWRS
jgi:hypothetical protein